MKIYKEVSKEIDKENVLNIETVKRARGKRIRLYNDEIFVPIEKYKNIYISNYGRVLDNTHAPFFKTISKDNPKKGKAISSNSKKQNEYYYTKLGEENKKEYIHTLVAYAFCNLPINPFNEELEVHHLKKFNPLKSNMINNRADNLMIIKKSQHGTIEGIKTIRTTYLPSLEYDKRTGKPLRKADRQSFDNILEACKFLNINFDDFVNLIIKKPAKYIGEVAESHFYKKYLINIVKYKPKINKKLNLSKASEIMTLDRW
jgi:hypothetical protein